MQYCIKCRRYKPENEFYDIRPGYHGYRRWCKYHTAQYNKKRNEDKKRLLRKLIQFWNEHKQTKLPLPK
jgi:hypothetical protein